MGKSSGNAAKYFNLNSVLVGTVSFNEINKRMYIKGTVFDT